MKKLSLVVAATCLALAVPMTVFAASPHDMHAEHSPAHEEVVDGVKATFTIQTMADAMKGMGMEMPKGVKETHHISVSLKDVKSGTPLTEGVVKIKLQSPDKSDQTKDLIGMQGHFGADFVMSKKGKYGVMSRFLLKDGKTRSVRFWYPVK
ncbi:hypothetical protein KI809_04925 [Geobacter pelophilus]|uniref:YtkA-like domain-containing protein n=1 Tax=Geoanaerobacter pelophilus TaxID=60036 RepID=A0AAW4L8X7_9BACT|nr:hypothetical protein [Geoanaerobacter pelophilus]MBT0663641.1 hypothetical protein [Geoanaerobacter pelophilus]